MEWIGGSGGGPLSLLVKAVTKSQGSLSPCQHCDRLGEFWSCLCPSDLWHLEKASQLPKPQFANLKNGTVGIHLNWVDETISVKMFVNHWDLSSLAVFWVAFSTNLRINPSLHAYEPSYKHTHCRNLILHSEIDFFLLLSYYTPQDTKFNKTLASKDPNWKKTQTCP